MNLPHIGQAMNMLVLRAAEAELHSSALKASPTRFEKAVLSEDSSGWPELRSSR